MFSLFGRCFRHRGVQDRRYLHPLHPFLVAVQEPVQDYREFDQVTGGISSFPREDPRVLRQISDMSCHKLGGYPGKIIKFPTGFTAANHAVDLVPPGELALERKKISRLAWNVSLPLACLTASSFLFSRYDARLLLDRLPSPLPPGTAESRQRWIRRCRGRVLHLCGGSLECTPARPFG